VQLNQVFPVIVKSFPDISILQYQVPQKEKYFSYMYSLLKGPKSSEMTGNQESFCASESGIEGFSSSMGYFVKSNSLSFFGVAIHRQPLKEGEEKREKRTLFSIREEGG
jgi:hypothetical protein